MQRSLTAILTNSNQKQLRRCDMSCLSRDAVEVFPLLGCYTGYVGGTQFNEHVRNSHIYTGI